MTADRDIARRLGISHREFSLALLRAERKRWTKEPMTEIEQRVWDESQAVGTDAKKLRLQ